MFLGGAEPLPGFDYVGRPIINIHERHASHMKSFLLTPDLAARQKKAKDPLRNLRKRNSSRLPSGESCSRIFLQELHVDPAIRVDLEEKCIVCLF